MDYDVIGDIHGQAGKLRTLLATLGYLRRNGAYRHPQGRVVIFLGDLIDRGPEQIDTVTIVREMVGAGSAKCILGNHELNAIGYATTGKDGRFLRPHTDRTYHQHARFLAEVGEGTPLHRDIVDWFRTLPLCLDLGGIRAVHAWWNDDYARIVSAWQTAGSALSNDRVLCAAFDRNTLGSVAVDGLTKGLEVKLPAGYTFVDHSGIVRKKARVRWWKESLHTYRDAVIVPEAQAEGVPDLPLPKTFPTTASPGVPVFIGHYWLAGIPEPLSPRIACLDYGAGNGGPLVAYRWNGEPAISAAGFVCVDQAHAVTPAARQCAAIA